MRAVIRRPQSMSYNHRGREPRPNRLEIRLSNSELERLDRICAETDRPASAVVRLALDRYADNLGRDDSPIEQIQQHTEEPTGHR